MQLRVTSAVLSGTVYELDGEYFTIGRESDNSICIDHSSVSKHHAILKMNGDDVQLLDLHSTNGIIVNGEQRVVAHLRDSDKLVLGEVELHFDGKRKTSTQRMPLPLPPEPEPKPSPAMPPPPVPQKPVAMPPPPPTPLPQKPVTIDQDEPATPKPVLQKPVTTDQDAAATPKRKLELSAIFRREEHPDKPPALPTPPTREAIHANLAETFGKMGLELPQPPPAAQHASKPVALPPAPKPVSPSPRVEIQPEPAQTAEIFGKMEIEPPKQLPASQAVPKPVTLPPTPKPATPSPRIEIQLTPAPAVAVLDLPLKQATPLTTEERPPKASSPRRMTPWIFVAGIVLLALGYLLNFGALKFIGLIDTLIGLFSLIFSFKFGGLIAPPKNRPLL